MRHFNPNGQTTALCGAKVAAAEETMLDDVDCERCLWKGVSDVQNGMNQLLARLHKVTRINRVTVINPVAKKGVTNG